MAFVSLHNVHKVYPPEQAALRGISLKVNAGEFIFIAGASGAGKTTLFKLLFGAELASSGQVHIAGKNLKNINKNGISNLRRNIGVVFQDYKLIEKRNVVENVSMGLDLYAIKPKEKYELSKKILHNMGLADRLDAFPRMLSGGEQQRVAIARALISKPKILLADEPTGNLDPEMSNVVFDLLLEANALGVTVIIATHNLGIIERLNLRTIILDRGKIVGDYNQNKGIE
ncbi:UNVERIFIED_CONTAM: hypothetical protein GTU68_055992 [Idotea baltica]|nr:hypothetical protein [Idotea baltica]